MANTKRGIDRRLASQDNIRSAAKNRSTAYTVVQHSHNTKNISTSGYFYPIGKLSIDNFNGPAASGLDMQKGLNGELALGQYSDSGSLASELGIGYFECKGSPSGEPGSARLTAVPVYITWKFISSPGGLSPYLTFGLGGYYTTLQTRQYRQLIDPVEDNLRISRRHWLQYRPWKRDVPGT